jgi:hypothetical protein
VSRGQPNLKEVAFNHWLETVSTSFSSQENIWNTLVDSGFETLAFLSLLTASAVFFDASYGFLGAALEARGFVAFGIVSVELLDGSEVYFLYSELLRPIE